MKATGIVRRIDDLGRVVIPKEIRRTLHIKEGDPLEFYTTDEGVVLKRYDIAGALYEEAKRLSRSVSDDRDDIGITREKEIQQHLDRVCELLEVDTKW